MVDNIYKAPASDLTDLANQPPEYAGFWIRFGASMIDTVLMLIIIYPILMIIYGKNYFENPSMIAGFWDFLISYVFPAGAIILFWVYKSATPGKMACGLSIVDAETGGKPSTGKLIGRYFAYYVSAIGLCIGFLWVGFDSRKQGWHDKIAGTLVIKKR